jgi:ribosomal protein S18 acetylase RimI-like enzyme
VTSIRSATPDDARIIATIHVESWRAAYRGIVPDDFLASLSLEKRELAWQQSLLAGDSSTWVALEAETILGWISAAASRDADAEASTGEIWAVYIAPGHWGRGVGRSLYETAERSLLQKGFTELTLWVLTENERAIGFYQSNGFVLDIARGKTIERGGKTLTEDRFRKPLIAGSDGPD